jgi:hypothetical protein
MADGAVERRILIECIVSDTFLSHLVGRLGKEPFSSQDGNSVWGLCENHFRKYGKAPHREIETIYARWAVTCPDEPRLKRIERLLGSISDEYEREEGKEQGFTLDLAEQHFNGILLDRLQDDLRKCLDRGATAEAMAHHTKFKPVDLRTPPPSSILLDDERNRIAFEEKPEVLIEMPGVADSFFGAELSEGSFIGMMATAKGGKSWMLLELAWQAMRQGRKVAYFQVGDMTEKQIRRRFFRRACWRPLDARDYRFPKAIHHAREEDLATVEHENRITGEEVSWATAEAALHQQYEKYGGDIRLSYHPIKSVSILDIKNTLERWDGIDYNADVVVIDYAWNLAHIEPKGNPVEQTSLTWAMMRQLSEVRNCLVITANQTNKEGMRAWVLTRSHFADSKMILGAVTGFLGINMTEEEKEHGLMRLNWVARREEAFLETKCLWCASCIDVGSPMVLTCM